MIKPEEVDLMFGKWRDESIPLRVVARLACGVFAFDCRVINGDSTAVALRLRTDGDACEFSLADCAFEYAEPERVKDPLLGNRVVVSILVATRLADRLIFCELETD